MHHLTPPTKSYTHLLFPHHKHIKPHKTTSQYHNISPTHPTPTPFPPHKHPLHITIHSTQHSPPEHHHNTTLHNTTTHSSIPIHLNSHPSSHKRLFRIPAECMCARAGHISKNFTKKWTNENVNPTWSTFTHRSHHITNLTNLTSITFNPS